jgi:hypothetical protein
MEWRAKFQWTKLQRDKARERERGKRRDGK